MQLGYNIFVVIISRLCKIAKIKFLLQAKLSEENLPFKLNSVG